MGPDDVTRLFTRDGGDYVFARWGRPIAPVIFGVEEQTLGVIKGAIEAICILAGHRMAETDPELGVNNMWFFVRDWDELAGVPDLDRLIPDLGPLLTRLNAAEANQYRVFRFDETGGIKACFVFLRMDEHLQAISAEALALNQATQMIVLWSDLAFRDQSPLARVEARTVLRPDISAVIRAAYDPVMPVMANDPSHALRLAARLNTSQN